MKIKIEDIDFLNKKGVYKIVNISNNKLYIGSTVNSFKIRLKSHFSKLKRGVHDNIHLQNAFNKYGENSFEFSIIFIGDNIKEIRDKEQEYINKLNVCNPSIGYNIDPDVCRKIRNSITNSKISKTLKRKYASGEIKRAVYENIYKGKKRPDFAIKMRGKKHAVLISDINNNPIAIFRGNLDIEEYTKDNIIPGIILGLHSSNGYFISKKMVAKYINTNKFYKGLLFTRVMPLSSEMGIVKWVNCWKGEIPNQQPSQPLTKLEGSETNS